MRIDQLKGLKYKGGQIFEFIFYIHPAQTMEVETPYHNPTEIIDSTLSAFENFNKQSDVPSHQVLEERSALQHTNISESKSSDTFIQTKKESKKAFAVIRNEDNKIYFVNSRELFIGRVTNDEDNVLEKKDRQHFQICRSDKVSRLSARIFWSNESKCWVIQKISKNTIFVDKQQLEAIGSTCPLSIISAVQIHKTKFYFCQAYVSSD